MGNYSRQTLYNLDSSEKCRSLLTKEQERELLDKAKTGDEAAEWELVERNLRLIIQIACSHFSYKQAEDFDLVSHGITGMREAIRRYDKSKAGDNKFSTHAAWYIRKEMRVSRSGDRTIKIPIHHSNTMYEINSQIKRFIKEHGREPTDEELRLFENCKKSEFNIAYIKSKGNRFISLDNTVSEDGREAYESLPSSGELNPLEKIISDESINLWKVIKSLDPFDKDLAVARFLRKEKLSLEETTALVNKKYNLNYTMETIRKRAIKLAERIRGEYRRLQDAS